MAIIFAGGIMSELLNNAALFSSHVVGLTSHASAMALWQRTLSYLNTNGCY